MWAERGDRGDVRRSQGRRKGAAAGYQLRIKTGVNYADNQAFNNLIQTSLQ